mmetsp:Transcript_16644/g.40776  ORF Transcript_16644/g.40776 Transcript_16644/m.40776 type:complete len:385 (-) Transcript_16644:2296-3450(-)
MLHRLLRGGVQRLREELANPLVGHLARGQARGLQRRALDLRRGALGHGLEHRPGVQAVAHAGRHAPGAPRALRGAGPGRGVGVHHGHGALGVEAHLTHQPTVHHGQHVVDGHGRLGDVGGQDDLDLTLGRGLEAQLLLLLRHLAVQRDDEDVLADHRRQRLERLHALLDLLQAGEEHKHGAVAALGELRFGDVARRLRRQRHHEFLALALLARGAGAAAALERLHGAAGGFARFLAHDDALPRPVVAATCLRSPHVHRAAQRADAVFAVPGAPPLGLVALVRAPLHLRLQILPLVVAVTLVAIVLVVIVIPILVVLLVILVVVRLHPPGRLQRVSRPLLRQRLLQLSLQILILSLQQREGQLVPHALRAAATPGPSFALPGNVL